MMLCNSILSLYGMYVCTYLCTGSLSAGMPYNRALRLFALISIQSSVFTPECSLVACEGHQFGKLKVLQCNKHYINYLYINIQFGRYIPNSFSVAHQAAASAAAGAASQLTAHTGDKRLALRATRAV